MALENENSSFGGGFSMETIEPSMGNQQLLDSFLSPETASGSPDDVTIIDKDKEKKDKEEAAKKKVADSKKPAAAKEEEKIENNLGEEFLGGEAPEEKEEKEKEEIPTEEEEDNRFSSLAKDLFKLNVFTKEDEEEEAEITTPQELLERFNLEKRKGAEEQIQTFLGRFGEDYQNAFQAIFVKGADPKEYFGTYNNIENIAELDLTQEANQIAIVKKGLQEQGYKGDILNSKLEKIKSYGDLEDEAKATHQILLEKEMAKLAQIEQESEIRIQTLAKTKQQYAQNVNNILQEKLKTKEFDGIPVNPKLANEIQDFLVTDRSQTNSGEKLTEFDKTILELKRPENHALKVKVGLLLKMLQTDPTLSSILRTAKTKETLKSKSSKLSGGKPSAGQTPKP